MVHEDFRGGGGGALYWACKCINKSNNNKKIYISCEEAHVICEKVDLWSGGSKPVSQEVASLPIKSSLEKTCMLTTQQS